jgi:hypothetical protein
VSYLLLLMAKPTTAPRIPVTTGLQVIAQVEP